MANKHLLLMSFYNPAALGIRYLANACERAGIESRLLFFKRLSYEKPQKCTQLELDKLKAHIEQTAPAAIGLSVMSSMCLETVFEVNAMIKRHFDMPVIWGGVYATLFPERSLEHADFVIRGEGEETIVELCDALFNGKPYEDIQNLAYKKDTNAVVNELRPLCEDLDSLGFPAIDDADKTLLDGDEMLCGDPRRNNFYEIASSRGCPFACSYCSATNLKRLYRGKGAFLRTRSVDSVMAELNDAKAKLPQLNEIRFWDEVFPGDDQWMDDFVRRYKAEINLPFEIWSHPLKTERVLIGKLVEAGLFGVVMGIQSGCSRIRKRIFHRPESQEEIIEASRVLAECKVPKVSYDLMLQHPFESNDDIRESYELCIRLAGKFKLQLHGLGFLPGTDIVEIAVKQKLFTREELEKMMYSSYEEQYDMFIKYKNNDPVSNFWYALIILTQYPSLRGITKRLAKKPDSKFNRKLAAWLSKLPERITRAKKKTRAFLGKIKRKIFK